MINLVAICHLLSHSDRLIDGGGGALVATGP